MKSKILNFYKERSFAKLLASCKGFSLKGILLLAALPLLLPISVQAQTDEETVAVLITIINDHLSKVAPRTTASFVATPILPYGVQLQWSVSDGSDEYRLEHQEPNSSVWVTHNAGLQTSFSMSPLQYGTHAFRLTSCGRGFCSEASVIRTVAIAYQPSADVDGDGVPDSFDDCAGTGSGVPVDAFGCPTAAPSLVNCVSANGSVRTAQSCNANEQIDTDQDGEVDATDQYPLQHATQCPAN